MTEPFELSYIEKTEAFIEQNKDKMEKEVYSFIKELCETERKYIEMLKEWSNKKGVGKMLV